MSMYKKANILHTLRNIVIDTDQSSVWKVLTRSTVIIISKCVTLLERIIGPYLTVYGEIICLNCHNVDLLSSHMYLRYDGWLTNTLTYLAICQKRGCKTVIVFALSDLKFLLVKFISRRSSQFHCWPPQTND